MAGKTVLYRKLWQCKLWCPCGAPYTLRCSRSSPVAQHHIYIVVFVDARPHPSLHPRQSHAMFRILSLSLLLATLAVSQSSESSTPTVTTAIVKSSTSSSVFSFTATTAVDYTINTPYPMPTSTNIPKSSVQGNSSVQFTFPKAGDYCMFIADHIPPVTLTGPQGRHKFYLAPP